MYLKRELDLGLTREDFLDQGLAELLHSQQRPPVLLGFGLHSMLDQYVDQSNRVNITYRINDSNHAIWDTCSGSRAIEEGRVSVVDFECKLRTLILKSARNVHYSARIHLHSQKV
jgi:hypothetical protein